MCYRFSPDAVHWGRFLSPTALWPMVTGSADSSAAVGVPGGMVFIHGGGVVLPASSSSSSSSSSPSAGPPQLQSGGSGVTTFFSPDGQDWTLVKHVWPLYGGYSTVEAIGLNNKTGAVEQYGTLFEGGGPFGKRQAIIFQAFNVSALPKKSMD